MKQHKCCGMLEYNHNRIISHMLDYSICDKAIKKKKKKEKKTAGKCRVVILYCGIHTFVYDTLFLDGV